MVLFHELYWWSHWLPCLMIAFTIYILVLNPSHQQIRKEWKERNGKERNQHLLTWFARKNIWQPQETTVLCHNWLAINGLNGRKHMCSELLSLLNIQNTPIRWESNTRFSLLLICSPPHSQNFCELIATKQEQVVCFSFFPYHFYPFLSK